MRWLWWAEGRNQTPRLLPSSLLRFSVAACVSSLHTLSPSLGVALHGRYHTPLFTLALCLQEFLHKTEVPPSLRAFVLHGEVPATARERLAAVGLAN